MTSEKTAQAGMDISIGELLKQGRLRQRLSIQECAKRTRISQRYLEDLEENRWENFPSQSHRIGFLNLYARFLGVPAEELVARCRREQAAPAVQPKSRKPSESSRVWVPASWTQLCGVIIALLIVAWGVYHWIRWQIPEPRAIPVVRIRPRQSPRLVAPRSMETAQRIRVQAQADCWLRVVTQGRLLFEGILPGGAAKNWSGPGPFELKIGNVKALTVFWNDQPVDIQSTARGPVNELRLPIAK